MFAVHWEWCKCKCTYLVLWLTLTLHYCQISATHNIFIKIVVFTWQCVNTVSGNYIGRKTLVLFVSNEFWVVRFMLCVEFYYSLMKCWLSHVKFSHQMHFFSCCEVSFIKTIVKLRSRSRSEVRSRSGPWSGLEDPRTRDPRPGPGLTLNLVCHLPPHPLTTSKLFYGR